MNRLKGIGYGLLSLFVIGNIVLYFFLPDELVMQITADGSPGTTLPKLLGLGLLLAIEIVASVQLIRKKENNDSTRWLMVAIVLFIVNLLVVIFNL